MEKAKFQLAIPCSPFFFIAFFIISFHCSEISAQTPKTTVVPVGVILDLSSETGKGCMTSIQMAYDDFYAANPDYSTRVNFTFWDSGGNSSKAEDIASNLTGYSMNCEYNPGTKDLMQAVIMGLQTSSEKSRPVGATNPGGSYTKSTYCVTMLGDRNVEAIMGLQTSSETYTVASICDQTQVPLISFSRATSPLIRGGPYNSARGAPYNSAENPSSLIRGALYNSAGNPSSLIRGAPYNSAGNLSILIHASLNYSSELLPIGNLTKHFNWKSIVHVYEEDGASIYQSLNRNLLVAESIVIPLNSNNSQIKEKLKQMMASTYRAFLVDVVSPQAIRLFQLADELGMMSKGYVWIVTSGVGDILDTLQSANLSSMNGVVGFRTIEQSDKERMRLKDFFERYKARFRKDHQFTVNTLTTYQLWAYDAAWAVAMAVEKTKKSDPSFALPPRNGSLENLTKNILNTSFSKGLAGNFSLVDGQRQFSTYEIVNVVDNVTTVIGFWTQQYGISESKNSPAESNYRLKATWPGNLTEPPKSSTYNSTALKIGIPLKSTFNGSLGDFSIRVFKAAADLLPKQLNYTTVPVDSTSNVSSLLSQLDGIVGDIIIPEDDTEAYFTRQYMEGGVQMVVRTKQDTSSMNMWMFLRPFPLKLWIVSIVFFVFTGLAIWVTEHRVNPDFVAGESFIRQLGNTLYFSFSTLVYAQDGRLKSNLSRILLIIWLFVVLVLTTSYNASLSAILTAEKLKPAVNSLDDLKQSGVFVGYQEGSIVRDLLTKTFGFSESQIRSLRTAEYEEALNKGSANKGVSAIFDVKPYITVFFNQSRCSNYTIVGPTYQSNGFGFAFKNHNLLRDLSEAILNSKVRDLKTNVFNNVSGCDIESNDKESHTLSFTSFGGIFIITGVVSGLMVIISLIMYVHKNKNHLKDILRDNNVTVRDRISRLWKSFLSLESLEAGDSNGLGTNEVPRTDPPERESPVETQEIKKGR